MMLNRPLYGLYIQNELVHSWTCGLSNWNPCESVHLIADPSTCRLIFCSSSGIDRSIYRPIFVHILDSSSWDEFIYLCGVNHESVNLIVDPSTCRLYKHIKHVETDKYASHIWKNSSYYDKCMQKNCSLKKKTCPLGLKSIVAKINQKYINQK